MRIAILGGGGVGVCAALEIAARGHQVDIFDLGDRPVTQASCINEGKIHQGFLYAKDRSGRTARTMAEGALAFRDRLSRWIDVDTNELVLSTPFVYAVHRDSMVSLDDLIKHFKECVKIFEDLRRSNSPSYLGVSRSAHFRPLSHVEIEEMLDPVVCTAAFLTSELAVDPRPIAEQLRAAVSDSSHINFVGRTRVVAVEEKGPSRYWVKSADGTAPEGPYNQVVNALWDGRLAIDQSMGLWPDRPWIFRHKFGNRVRIFCPEDIPSITMVLGPFGDIVNFGSNGLYLSWYPVGMTGTSAEIRPPAEWRELETEARYAVFHKSLEHWVQYCPRLRKLSFNLESVDPASGVIFAWGETDIDDPASGLHDRSEIGIRSVGGYHSVNTGKYTMVPLLGFRAAERVLARVVS